MSKPGHWSLSTGKADLRGQGDYCQLVAINQTISLDLFLAINPSINSTCGNLLTGVNYCVFPTQNWNVTATSTVVTPPTTIPTGTTQNCYELSLSLIYRIHRIYFDNVDQQ